MLNQFAFGLNFSNTDSLFSWLLIVGLVGFVPSATSLYLIRKNKQVKKPLSLALYFSLLFFIVALAIVWYVNRYSPDTFNRNDQLTEQMISVILANGLAVLTLSSLIARAYSKKIFRVYVSVIAIVAVWASLWYVFDGRHNP